MPPRSTQRRLVLLTAALSAVPLLIPAAAVAVGGTHVTYGGNAYGSTVRLGVGPTLVTSGKTSLVSLCTGFSGDTNTNNTAAATIPGVGTIGAVLTSTSSTLDGTNPESLASAETGATNLLGGAVQLDAITSDSHMELSGATYRGGGSVTLVNAMINGQAISNSPTRDQTISIPGLATIVLNHQHAINSGQTHAWNVTAVTITVLPGNPLGVAAGTIILSSATASLHAPSFHRPFGDAYGSTVNLANGVVVSGRTAFVALPCGGSDGVVETNNVTSVSVPSALSTGVVTTTATSTDSASVTTATTTAQVADLSLLGGVIHATAVTATANASRNASGITFPGSGATFVGLTIAGLPHSGTPAPNTVIVVPLLGTVTLNLVKTGVAGVQVYAIQVVLSVSLGVLNPGSIIRVSAAHAGVYNR